jgi:hypothetical protein
MCVLCAQPNCARLSDRGGEDCRKGVEATEGYRTTTGARSGHHFWWQGRQIEAVVEIKYKILHQNLNKQHLSFSYATNTTQQFLI